MSCSSCVSSLSGFGQDNSMDVSPELAAGLKSSLAKMIGAPVVGSIVGAAGGAIAWRDHRVIGGVIGLVGGGLLGSVVGGMLAQDTMESVVLPELDAAAQQVAASSPAASSGSANSAAPLIVQNPGFTAPLVSSSLGVPVGSLIAKLGNSAIQAAALKRSKTSPNFSIPSVHLPGDGASKLAIPAVHLPGNQRLNIPAASVPGNQRLNIPAVTLPQSQQSILPQVQKMTASPSLQPPAIQVAQTTRTVAPLTSGSTSPTADASNARTFVPAGTSMHLMGV